MDNQYNLHAYDEVEKVQLEMSTEKINAYLRDKLQSAVGNVDFIKRHVYKGRKLDVCVGDGQW